MPSRKRARGATETGVGASKVRECSQEDSRHRYRRNRPGASLDSSEGGMEDEEIVILAVECPDAIERVVKRS